MVHGPGDGDLDIGNPQARRRVLGVELRRTRLDVGLTAALAGREIDRSGSWISRLEAGKIGIKSRELHELLDVYRVSNVARRHYLETLAVEGRRPSWWSSYRDVVSESYSVFIGLEDVAQSIFEYQERVVPGLLQTESYMRALFNRYAQISEWAVAPPGIERLIRVRVTRQDILRRPSSPALTVVIDESVVRRVVGGPDVHRGQLESLIEAAGRVDIRVLPFDAAGGPSMVPSFTLLTPRGASRVAYSEVLERSTMYESAMAEPYVKASEWLLSAALPADESVARIADFIEESAGESA